MPSSSSLLVCSSLVLYSDTAVDQTLVLPARMVSRIGLSYSSKQMYWDPKNLPVSSPCPACPSPHLLICCPYRSVVCCI